MSTKHELAIVRLQKQVTDLSNALANLITDDDLRHLIQIIKGPGWTTPTEFAYAIALLKAMQFQVNAIVTLRSQLVQGSQQVLSSFDPVPPAAHIEELEKLITDVSDALANLKSDEDLKLLLQIIVRPGWTTLPEVAFSAAIVSLLKAQTSTLANLTAQVMKCSELVAESK